MSYVPPGVKPQTLGQGQHPACLVEMKELDSSKLANFKAQAVFIAKYQTLEDATEVEQVIKFNGSRADFYAGQTIERLHLAAGLPEPIPGEPIDLSALQIQLNGVELLLEVNEKGYVNGIVVPEVLSEDVI
jgi:hypothetical protein